MMLLHSTDKTLMQMHSRRPLISTGAPGVILLVTISFGSLLYGQNQTPANVPSPDAGIKESLEGLWVGTKEVEGRFSDADHQRYKATVSASCVISNINNTENYSARCSNSWNITNVDAGGSDTRNFEGTLRLRRQGKKLSGYAEFSRMHVNSDPWEELDPGTVIEGTLLDVRQLAVGISWDKSNRVNLTLQKQ